MTAKSLTEELKAIRDGSTARASELYDGLVARLTETGALAGALKAGDTFPDFQLASADGRFVTRADVLANGPAIFVFDRGAWCPYCSAVLGAWAKVADRCRAVGATLVAITPEAGGRALRTKVDHNLDFDVLCDLDNVLALECGLVYPVSEELRQGYLARGLDFEKIYGNKAWMLPAPATFVVRPGGVIAHATIDADFRYRQEPSEILKLLATLR